MSPFIWKIGLLDIICICESDTIFLHIFCAQVSFAVAHLRFAHILELTTQYTTVNNLTVNVKFQNLPKTLGLVQILAAFSCFQKRIDQIEQLVMLRNQDKRLKHRNGRAQVPYELLHPSSEPGLTGKGVPNSASI